MVPWAVQETLQARLDRLDADTREVVSAASVLGRTFSRPFVEQLLDGRPLGAQLSELQRLDLVVETRRGPRPSTGSGTASCRRWPTRACSRTSDEHSTGAWPSCSSRCSATATRTSGCSVTTGRPRPATRNGPRATWSGPATPPAHVRRRRGIRPLRARRRVPEASWATPPVRGRRCCGSPWRVIRPSTTSERTSPGWKPSHSPRTTPSVRPPDREPHDACLQAREPRTRHHLVRATGWVSRHLYTGLLRLAPEGGVIPDGASRLSVSPDGRTYRFGLREEALWHDGAPVTAADYVFAFDELVVGDSFGTALLAHIESVKAVGPLELEVGLSRPLSHLPALIALGGALPVAAPPVGGRAADDAVRSPPRRQRPVPARELRPQGASSRGLRHLAPAPGQRGPARPRGRPRR